MRIVMATKALLLLLAFSALFFDKINCLVDLSPTTMVESLGTITFKDITNKTFIDPQSTFYSRIDQTHKTKSCKIEINPESGRPEMFKLRIEKASKRSLTGSNDFSSLLVFDRNKDSNFFAYKGLKKSAASLLHSNNLDSLNITIHPCQSLLLILEIYNNNLSSLPVEAFRGLDDLLEIDLSENNFNSIPWELFIHNRKLKIIKITENKVNLTKLPPNLFSGFNDLEEVQLRGTGLQQLPEDLFWGSCNLKKIDLRKNYLQALPKNLLRDARKLEVLDLHSNQLVTVPSGFFVATNNLYQLFLSKNHITTLSSSDVFLGLNSLLYLYMDNNGMVSIHPDAFIPLSKLRVAYFSRNHLHLSTGLYNDHGQVSPFRHCPHLRTLGLSHNNISQIFSDWLVDHRELFNLHLSYNSFNYLEAKDLNFKSDNLLVNLTNNNIKMVNLTQVGQYSKNLNSSRWVLIDLNYNPIDCYCDVYSLLSYVKRITYDHPKIDDSLKLDDLNYVRLHVDHLSCNAPENFQGKLLENLLYRKLTCSVENGRSEFCASGGKCDCHIEPDSAMLHIDCDRKNLTEAPAWINTWNIKWTYLNLSGNALQRTPNMKKGGYESVFGLDLSKNQINRIEDDFMGPANLHVLNLNHNKLSWIDNYIKILSLWNLTENLKMRENPWTCNKEILAFWEEFRNGPFRRSSWDMMNFTCNITIHPGH